MNVLIAALLGLVQGLTEFLPVSSSGHLVLLQTVFGIGEGALFFDTVLHMGTLVAVFAVFYREIWALVKKPLQTKVYMLLAATAVTAVVYVAFSKIFSDAFEGRFLGFGFLITGAVLIVSGRLAHGDRTADKMKLPEALAVGAMQGIAILPGVSRSGSTIAGARLFGLSKESAAEFSFILSIPAILGSLLLQIPDVIAEGTAGISALCLITGFLFAAASGYFAIRWMLNLIVKRSLRGFAVYVTVLGIFVLADQFIFNVFFTNPF